MLLLYAIFLAGVRPCRIQNVAKRLTTYLMAVLTKIAFVSPAWTTWQHRLVSGALRYVDTHPRLIVRTFAPATDLVATAAKLEEWGAQGVFGMLDQEDQKQFLGALKQPIPLVNSALAKERPGVVTVVADFSGFVEVAVNHLRQLGLRSLAMLLLEEGSQIRKHLMGTFLRIAKPSNGEKALLLVNPDRKKIWDPHASIKPVPATLAGWLHSLPKPVGILSPLLGGGGYLIRCCQALGLRVPEDVAVVGGDDNDLSLAGEPTLTSVLPALETMGFDAISLLFDMIGGKHPPQSIIRLKCMDLHVRESTGLRKPEICDIAAALQCIRENACRGLTVKQLIRQTQCVSRATFYRSFHQAVRKSPAEAIRERKLDEVRRLLASTELPLSVVSDLCGFSSPKVLARLFRAEAGTTPRDFRKSHQRLTPHSPEPATAGDKPVRC